MTNRTVRQLEFERRLKPGDEVRARWARAGERLEAAGEVVSVGTYAVRVRLEVPVFGRDGFVYPNGWVIGMPRTRTMAGSVGYGVYANGGAR